MGEATCAFETTVDAGALDGDGLREHLQDLSVARSRLDAAEAAAITAFDRSRAFLDDGAASVRAWLAHNTGILTQVAGARVHFAKRLRRVPLMAAALAAGTVTESHCRVLFRCITPRTRVALTRDEAVLVQTATLVAADIFNEVITNWLAHEDPDGPGPERGNGELHVSPMLDGACKIDGTITNPEDALILRAELEARIDAIWREDQKLDPLDARRTRSHAERALEALLEMAKRSSAIDPQRDLDPNVRNPRGKEIIAVVNLADPDAPARGEDGTLLSPATIARWACYATITRVALAANNVVINVGTTTYVPNRAQRRALIARDKGCVIPGCGRRARWCEAHHVNPYPHGPTDLDNLLLLCDFHHHEVHRQHLHITAHGNQQFTITRADGTPLRQRPPPDNLAA